ncbi:hypothetical protein H2199_005374 [Coniosporium tulheliwenetii]|uniref:Uncharacterized protein n=1 Tax=Coniosporium tulheliwenetii TaxID=3383036 RepID=A0ACC2Z172_9PEZI|nr:hypothetical protein H2199_005374 [Cladosporium sp. JES 115]
MRIVSLALFTGLSSANIVFNRIQPSCNHTELGYSGCLRGQHCTTEDICEAAIDQNLYPHSFHYDIPSHLDTREVRADGRCGKEFGGATCDANGPYGGCCSAYGFCGKLDGHCLVSNGCQNGCRDGPAPTITVSPGAPTSSPPRPDGRCGKDVGGATCDAAGPFGGCCSEYGFCGNTDGHCLVKNGCQNGCKDGGPGGNTPQPSPDATTSGEPILGKPTSAATAPGSEATAIVTTDGSCGATNKNAICGNWPQGGCCSMYGFCGSTTSHCGDGCQSGPCLKGAVVPAPGPSPAPMNPNPGYFKVVGDSGVPVMHAGLMPNGRVAFLDKVENYTKLKLRNGQYAYASEYDPVTNQVVPLAYGTNSFCAGGTFLADGSFLAVGGNGPLDFIDPTVKNGFTGIRHLKRSSNDASLNGQDWIEPGNKLASARWYPSVQTMPDGRIFVVSGSLNGLDPSVNENNNPTYEVLSPTGVSTGQNIPMELLEKNQPYYMYPFMHLLRDGNMFVFTSKSSQIFNVNANAIRLLPLSSANNWDADVMICGGGAYQDITSPTDPSCGRINPLAPDAKWEMDSMPQGRGMVEGTLLPDGTVVWLNGANRGAQGFGIATDPTLDALLYDPSQPLGRRWTTGARSEIPRLYHSVALLLLDGTVMVTGSNPVEQPVLTPDAKNPYITDFRVEVYTPPYLAGENANKRPTDVVLSSKDLKADGSTFGVAFKAPAGAKVVKVALYYGGFVTHSVHMGHRMMFLDVEGWKAGAAQQQVVVKMPPNRNVAPPGRMWCMLLWMGCRRSGNLSWFREGWVWIRGQSH